MLPKLHSDNFPGLELIRPLYLVREDDIISFAKYNELALSGDKKAAIATLDKYKGDSFVGVTQKISQLRKEIVDSLPLYQRVLY